MTIIVYEATRKCFRKMSSLLLQHDVTARENVFILRLLRQEYQSDSTQPCAVVLSPVANEIKIMIKHL